MMFCKFIAWYPAFNLATLAITYFFHINFLPYCENKAILVFPIFFFFNRDGSQYVTQASL